MHTHTHMPMHIPTHVHMHMHTHMHTHLAALFVLRALLHLSAESPTPNPDP